MSEDDVENNRERKSKLDRTKEVVRKNWKPFTVGVGITTITIVTIIVTKRIISPTPLEGTNIFIDRSVVNDQASLYKVFNIYSPGFKNHGPSWMVKCLETGKLFRSQEHAVKVMGLSRDHMSNHLNGARHNVGGYHFERIGVAA